MFYTLSAEVSSLNGFLRYSTVQQAGFFLIKWYLYFVNKKEIDKSPISNFDIKIERFSYAYKDCNILTFGRWG